MPSYIVKVDPDKDLYVLWSTVTNSPHWWGTQEEVRAYYLNDSDLKESAAIKEFEERIERANKQGTSAHQRDFYGWDDRFFMYQQDGLLPREKLAEFLESFNSETQKFDLSMLEPMDST